MNHRTSHALSAANSHHAPAKKTTHAQEGHGTSALTAKNATTDIDLAAAGPEIAVTTFIGT